MSERIWQGTAMPGDRSRSTPSIFAREVTRQPCKFPCTEHAHDFPSDPTVRDENGVVMMPPGATAQNGFTSTAEPEIEYFQCRLCDEIVAAHDVADHVCPDFDESEYYPYV